MNASETSPIRLTQYSHGGDCGCKIAPGVLQDVLGCGASVCAHAGISVAGGPAGGVVR
jgi:selenide,water dikinase